MDINRPEITVNSGINSGNTMPVLDAIIGSVPSDIMAFLTTPFVNARSYEDSVGRALSIEEMRSLRPEIMRLVQEFNQIINGANLSGEQLQLAKIIFIYNHILGNVRYANVLSANDGTARVENRPEDRMTLYDSAYSALIGKQSICCGISDAIYLLCMVMGVPCEKWLWPDGGHAYNKVKLGNTWYKIDATFQVGFYPNAKAEGWNTNYLLTATESSSLNSNQPMVNYSRTQIDSMKNFLENRGLNFNYSTLPKIEIKTTNDGLINLVRENQSLSDHAIDISNLQHIISKIDASMNAVPRIKIFNGAVASEQEKPVISYVPAEKKISIQRVNYKINIVPVNDNYVVNVETSDNMQQTFVTNSHGQTLGTLKRGCNVTFRDIDRERPASDIFDEIVAALKKKSDAINLPMEDRASDLSRITIFNRTDENQVENGTADLPTITIYNRTDENQEFLRR